MFSVYVLGRDDKIWNRPTESGSRWQSSGAYRVDKKGVVRWVHLASAADGSSDVEKGVKTLTEDI